MATLTTDTPVSGKKPLLYILSGSGLLVFAFVLYWLVAFGFFAGVPSLSVLFAVYLPFLVVALIALAGVVILLIGVVAAGVRRALRSSHWPS